MRFENKIKFLVSFVKSSFYIYIYKWTSFLLIGLLSCLEYCVVILAYFTTNLYGIPMYALYGQIYVIAIETLIDWNDPDSSIRVCHVCKREEYQVSRSINDSNSETYFKSRSSSSKSSKYSDPQRHARRPLITIMYVDVTTRNIPMPPPQVMVCWK